MDDVIPATRRMTYAELGQARGISAKSAERLAQRRRWPRQIGNDGMARVLVPFGEDHVTPRRRGRMAAPDIAERRGPDIGGVVRDAIRETAETLMAPLREQIEHERSRADRAEKRADEERARAEAKSVTVLIGSETGPRGPKNGSRSSRAPAAGSRAAALNGTEPLSAEVAEHEPGTHDRIER